DGLIRLPVRDGGSAERPSRLLIAGEIQAKGSVLSLRTLLRRELATACDAPDHGAPQSRAVRVRSSNRDFSIENACLILSDLGNIVNKYIHFRLFWIDLALAALPLPWPA